MDKEVIRRVTTYHEIGHYLLIKKFNKMFPSREIAVDSIKLFLEEDSPFNGCVESKYSFVPSETPDEVIKSIIDINIAGFAAPTLFYNIRYLQAPSMKMNDYQVSYIISSILLERYAENGIKTTQEEIMRERFIKSKEYLKNNKETLKALADLLYEKHRFTKEDIEEIDKKFGL